MKSKRYLPSLVGIFVLFHAGCSRDDPKASTATGDALSNSPVRSSEGTNHVLLLARAVQRHSSNKKPEQADKALRELTAKWDPIGKPLNDLEALLGSPHERDEASVSYRFDSGYSGWMWTFQFSNRIITNVQRVGID